MDVITGVLLGGGLRLAPEALRLIDRHLERRHELSMQDLEFKFAQAVGTRGSEAALPIFSENTLAQMQESYIQQAAIEARKRFPWVDAAAAFVRPGVTYALLICYMAARWSIYGEPDIEMFSSVLTFWFMDRVWKNRVT